MKLNVRWHSFLFTTNQNIDTVDLNIVKKLVEEYRGEE